MTTPPPPRPGEFVFECPVDPVERNHQSAVDVALVDRFIVAGIALIVLIAAAGFIFAVHATRGGNSGSPSVNGFVATAQARVCAPTKEGRALRSEMFYTAERHLTLDVVSSGDTPPRWCVFTTAHDSQMYWGAVHIGEANPLYKTLTAMSGEDLSETRATVIYQDLVPIKFASKGWVGFTANGYSEFATKNLATQILRLADKMAE